MSTLRQFSAASGLNTFLLIGGAAIDPLLSTDPVISDWDIVIVNDVADGTAVARALRQSTFEVGRVRRYQINLDQSATCFRAQHSEMGTFDISIVKDLGFIGPFDIESLYVTFPAGVVVDDYGALEAVHHQRAALIRPLHRESPAILAKRLLVLAAKYGLRFGPGSASVNAAIVIRNRLSRADQSPPSLPEQAACLSKFIRGLGRAPRPGDFLADAVDSGLLLAAIPPLDAVVRADTFKQLVMGDRRPTGDELLGAIEGLDRNGTCTSVMEALQARFWDGT